MKVSTQALYLGMDLDEAKEKFIQSWGTLGSSWGINRTMAQIFSLLLVSDDCLCAETIMSRLNISRGNANMNLRALIDWGLVYKEHKQGERKEYFLAEKDMWEVCRRIMIQRKQREIEPVMRVLEQVKGVEDPENEKEVAEFKETIQNLQEFVQKMDALSEKFAKSDRSWFFKMMMKVMK